VRGVKRKKANWAKTLIITPVILSAAKNLIFQNRVRSIAALRMTI